MKIFKKLFCILKFCSKKEQVSPSSEIIINSEKVVESKESETKVNSVEEPKSEVKPKKSRPEYKKHSKGGNTYKNKKKEIIK